MARNSASKIYRNFTGGLITEASELTYPENASVDEDNCIITRKGNRRRRLGCDFLIDNVTSTFSIDRGEAETASFSTHTWRGVNEQSGLDFLVQQFNTRLYFYDVSQGDFSPQLLPFNVELFFNRLPSAPQTVSQLRISMASGRGALFVCGEYLEPFIVEYDPDTRNITTRNISILVRDFEGVEDGLNVVDEPEMEATVAASPGGVAHRYNLFNQGWIRSVQGGNGNDQTVNLYDPFGNIKETTLYIDELAEFEADTGRNPSNAMVWWRGKNANNDYSTTSLQQIDFGTTPAPRGFFVYDIMRQNRSFVSGLGTLSTGPDGVAKADPDERPNRPSTVTFFSGRVWWTRDYEVFFSQVLDNVKKAGNCYQEADPTSETISDLIASDGGYIPIPEAERINRSLPFGNGVLLFAENGVWYVRGTDSGFSALDFAVDKISNIGTNSPDSVVQAANRVYFWSDLGIQMIAFNQVGALEVTNVSENTIQTFVNNSVAQEARQYIKGIFDPSENVIQWLFRDNSQTHLQQFQSGFNRILNYDVGMNAFYPWTLAAGAELPFLCGVYRSDTPNALDENRYLRYMCLVPNSGNLYRLAWCEFSSTNFTDWNTHEGGTGETYESRLLTGFELLDDTMRNKEITHLQTYFTRTEQNYVDEGDGNFNVDKPSSCMFRVRWDWADTPTSGKWSREVEAYRFGRLPLVDEDDLTFDSGHSIVTSKHKVRGHGRAIQFEFRSSKAGHDFDLLGWACLYTGNTLP